MNHRERVQTAIRHEEPDVVPADFASTAVTGIHTGSVEALRDHFDPREPAQLDPVTRQPRHSLMSYIASDEFRPAVEVSPDQLRSIMVQ